MKEPKEKIVIDCGVLLKNKSRHELMRSVLPEYKFPYGEAWHTQFQTQVIPEKFRDMS